MPCSCSTNGIPAMALVIKLVTLLKITVTHLVSLWESVAAPTFKTVHVCLIKQNLVVCLGSLGCVYYWKKLELGNASHSSIVRAFLLMPAQR